MDTPQLAPTKDLHFSAALAALKEGKFIARASWEEPKVLFLDPTYKWPDEKKPSVGTITVRYVLPSGRHETRFSLHERDILANDWKIVEPENAPQ